MDRICGIFSDYSIFLVMKWLRWAIPFGGAFYHCACQKAGFGIQSQYLLYRFQTPGGRYRHHFFYDARNVLEIDLFVEKCGHGDL